jgi:hypothetical protein
MATKPIKTLEELEQLVVAHLRTNPDTAGVQSVRAYLHERDSVGANWNIYRFEAGASDPESCQSAIRKITQRLRSEFNAMAAEHGAPEVEARQRRRMFRLLAAVAKQAPMGCSNDP